MTGLIELCDRSGIGYIENAPLSDYLTFRVGGPCRVMVFPDSADKIIEVLNYLRSSGIRYYIIGKGSNLLCSDSGFDGVILNTTKYDSLCVINDHIICSSGISLSRLCRAALDNSLSGLECEYGIPGSVGGAVYMNAGAYGGEIKDSVFSVTHITAGGELETVYRNKLDFGYRHSYYSDKDLFILKTEFALNKADREEIRNKMEDLLSRRKAKQPLDLPSAGSTFKRPEGYYAGALIEECGLKGYSIGGAQVSVKHAGFVVNTGNATCSDITALIDYCRKTVYEKTGVTLEPEVKYIS